MAEKHRAEAIRGKTMRWTWTEGPTAGSTHEHVFHPDGTVEWRAAGAGAAGGAAQERPEYAALQIRENVFLVSYLAPSGYTLTVVLDFRDHSLQGIASGAKEWYTLRGRFEVVG